MAKQKNVKHRDQFNFYKSFDDICLKLNDKQLSQFIRTLLDVQFLRKKYENVSFKDPMLDLVWTSCKFNIESQVDGYLVNKSKNNSLFIGVYDNKNGGLDGVSNGGLHEEQEQEQDKEEYIAKCKSEIYSNDFEIIWKWYRENTSRPIGDKKSANRNFLKQLKKVEYVDIKKAIYNYVQECKKNESFTKHLASFLNTDLSQYIETEVIKHTKPKKEILL